MRKNFVYIVILCISFLFQSCSKGIQFDESEKHTGAKSSELPLIRDIKIDIKKGPIVLGNKINNGASLSEARKLMAKKRSSFSNEELQATHYYVRFLPKDDREYSDLLKFDISSLPYDYEIAGNGSFYRDPSLSEDSYPWQYAYVPVAETLPSIQHEILDEVYLIEKTIDGGKYIFTLKQWEEYTQRSNTMESKAAGQTFLWFTTYDDLFNRYAGIPSAKVTVIADRATFYLTSAENGRVRINRDFISTEVPVSIRIEFFDRDNGNWHIVDKDKTPALIGFSTIPAIENYYRLDDTYLNHINAIQRAASKSFYGDKDNSGGYHPQKGDLSVKIAYIDEWKDKDPAGLYYGGSYSLTENSIIVKVWGVDSQNSEYTTDRIYGTTAHELGHHAHCVAAGKTMFNYTDKIIVESWARGVQFYLTQKEYDGQSGILIPRYETLSPGGYDEPMNVSGPARRYYVPDKFNYQDWPFYNSNNINDDNNKRFLAYSPLFVDLRDASNQALYYKAKNRKDYRKYPNDDIKGFGMADLLEAVSNSMDLQQLKDYLKTLYISQIHGNTHVKIDSLFNRYEHYWDLLKDDPKVQGKE